jgi:guanine nucleotide-binding protein G(I)/G(S)/G(T) subunit beta-1
MSVSPSPTDPNLFVSGSCDTTAKIWDIRTPQECVQNFLGHESDLNSVAFLGNGMGFGSASDDSSCRLFDLRSYGQVNCFASDKFTCGITSVDFSKSGRYLFAGYENATCQIWDTFGAGKTPVQSIGGSVGHENRVSCVGVNNGRNGTGGTALCTGSWDMSLKVWA